MATIVCDTCGKTLQPTQKYCPGCGRKNEIAFLILSTTSPALPQPSLPMFPNAKEPDITPPRTFENITDELIYQAVISQTNPYSDGQWGRLVFDDSVQKIWEESPVKKYSGNTFCVRQWPDDYQLYSQKYIEKQGELLRANQPNPFPRVNITLFRGMMFRDFAFQVQVTKGFDEGGLIFRASPDGKLYYLLSLYGGSNFDMALKLTTETNSGYPFHELLSSDLRFEALLLAVVIQDNVIDIYRNLRHVSRVFNTAYLNPGFIGLYADIDGAADYNVIKFSHAKLWVKDEVKDERGKYD